MIVTTTGTVKTNGVENAPMQDLGKMANNSWGTADVVTDVCSNITSVRWKDNKIVNAMSKFTGKEPIQSTKNFCKKQNKRVDTEQSNGPEYCSIHDQFLIKEVMMAFF